MVEMKICDECISKVRRAVEIGVRRIQEYEYAQCNSNWAPVIELNKCEVCNKQKRLKNYEVTV